LQNFDCASGKIAWEHILTALEFIPTHIACCAASTKPWTEIVLDDVPHYAVGQNVIDTGGQDKNDGKLTFSFSITISLTTPYH
jgi:hypothetical protein